MERPKRPYSLHIRTSSKKSRKIYYAQFRDERGAYSSAVSTGCTRHDDAVRWCEQKLKVQEERHGDMTLAAYANGFWNQRAVLDGWLEENPADHVKSIRVPTPSRSILSPAEALRLLATPEPWSDFRQYAINVLAATTGIRMGEVRALHVENVKDDHIEIRRSWEQGYGPRPPKADSIRDVPISPKVSAILAKVEQETRPTNLLFYGKGGVDTPISKNVIESHLRQALSNIGIPVAEQARRRMTFHAWRHFLNSMLRSHGVADVKTRRITRHRTEAMTDWYTDWKALDISEVVSIQTALLGSPSLAARERVFRVSNSWANNSSPLSIPPTLLFGFMSELA